VHGLQLVCSCGDDVVKELMQSRLHDAFWAWTCPGGRRALVDIDARCVVIACDIGWRWCTLHGYADG
jgi:hypothetical protein